MKPALVRAAGLGALLLVAFIAPKSQAQAGWYPPLPQAPRVAGPGYYYTNCAGAVYGPNYCVYPCFPPFNGMLPVPVPQPTAGGYPAGSPGFPRHPNMRSPRDYFMID
jgi:hypothetical protein